MMKHPVFLFLLMTCANSTLAQNWKLESMIAIEGIDKIEVDQLGNLYVAVQNGDLFKYSVNGTLLNEFSPQAQGRIDQIDVVSSLKILVFYEGLQEYVLLNRYLTAPVRYSFANVELGYITHTSLTWQQNIWVIDATDFALKLWNTATQSIDENKSLVKVLNPDQADIVALYTYQNRTYLLDQKSGIYVFDAIGNFLQKISAQRVTGLGFTGDCLLYKSGQQIRMIHLYDGSTKTIDLPEGESLSFKLSNKRLYTMTAQGVEIYKYLSDDFK